MGLPREDGDAAPRLLAKVAGATAPLGASLFLLGVLARAGGGVIPAAGVAHGAAHATMAAGLLAQAVCLVSVYALDARAFGRRGVAAFLSALLGLLLWFGFTAMDGVRDPLVDGGMGVVPGMAVVALGQVPLAILLARYRPWWPGLLLGVGAVVYALGRVAVLTLGPQVSEGWLVEVGGAAAYALGFVLIGRTWGRT